MQVRFGRWLWISAFAVAYFGVSHRGYAQFCTSDSDCNDNKSCTDNDHCSLGTNTCLFPRNDSACPASPFTCVETIGCDPTNANADPVTGCIYSRNDATCDDGIDCTTDGCDPANANADPTTGCVNSKDDLACPPSGFACEETIGCDPTNSNADPTTGCTYSRNDANCDDGADCTTDGCDPTNANRDADGCVYSKDDLACDDGDDCTTDGCDPLNSPDATGCVYSDIPDCCDDDDDCDDGKSCTDNDHCSLGTNTCLFPRNDSACPASPFTCVETIGCDPTNANADPVTGCIYSRNDATCDDGFSCTTDGCDPTNANADPTTGCVHSRNDAVCTAGPGGVDGKTCTDDGCNPANAPPGSTTGCQSSRNDSNCFDDEACTRDECNPDLGDPSSPSGCVYPLIDDCCQEDDDCPPPSDICMKVTCEFFDKEGTQCVETPIPHCGASPRVSSSYKGSLLYFSKVELKWDSLGRLTQDTFITIVNDYPEAVFVQWYFINGERPTPPLFTGSPPILVERSHRGWNWFDCTTKLTQNESTYMSAARGLALGCQRFTALDVPPRSPFLITDPLTYPGRPDPDPTIPGNRVLRGYAIAFAVDANGHEVSWNHLSGSVDLVNYLERSAWEYNGYAFQCLVEPTPGLPCGADNVLDLNGIEYSYPYDRLLLDFYAVNSLAFSPGEVLPGGVVTVSHNTDLTLFPVSVDLRQDNDGPITTKAKFDIWNQNEESFSGTTRCITCWDQTLLSNYGSPNNFLISNLHTDKGKARIDGIASDVCDPPGSCCNLSSDPDCFPSVNHPFIDKGCSQSAALLGVSAKSLFFAGPGAQRRQSDAGMNLVGQGNEPATVRWDIITPPQPLSTDSNDNIFPVQAGVESSTATPRDSSRGNRRGKE